MFTMNDILEAWRTLLKVLFLVGACMGTAAATMQIGKALFYHDTEKYDEAGNRKGEE